MGILTTVFWGSATWVVYTYVGYPCLVWGLAKCCPRSSSFGAADPSGSVDEPPVSIVMAVRNGESEIRAKLENLLSMDYPKDKLQIIVVSDGSTDGTVEAVRSMTERGVELVEMAEASGKPTALNYGVSRAHGSIVLFCDVRQRIEPQALRALVRHFADPKVGAVSGELMIEGDAGAGAYWKYEKLIRSAEGTLDSVPGATGALYAIRRELFRELPSGCLLDDVYTPMSIILEGYRVLFEPTARAYDREAELKDEFQRKARTLAGNFQLLEQLPRVMSPLHNRALWQFASHKLARLACPYALLGMLGSSAVLSVGPGWRLYAPMFGAQALGYGLALGGGLRGDRASRLERLAHTFVTLNTAAVEGLRRYLAGDFSWTSARAVSPTEPDDSSGPDRD